MILEVWSLFVDFLIPIGKRIARFTDADLFTCNILGYIYELGIFHANQTTKCLKNQGRTKGEGWSTANRP